MGNLFNYHGRFNRSLYWGYSLLIGLIWGIVYYSVGVIGGAMGTLLLVVGFIATEYASICVMIKRAHDLDKPGSFVILAFIPIANLYAGILFGFYKGTTGFNQYGPDPLSDEYNTSEHSSDNSEMESYDNTTSSLQSPEIK